jgi:carbamoyltransferase
MGSARGSEIRLTREVRFPHSFGLLYSTFTALLGFEVNEGEYKAMGMAPYGQPRYADKMRRLVRMYPDGSFSLDMDYFAFHRSTRLPYRAKFLNLFGTPRSPAGNFFTESSGIPRTSVQGQWTSPSKPG